MSKVETTPSDEEPVVQQPVVDQLSDAELDATAGGVPVIDSYHWRVVVTHESF